MKQKRLTAWLGTRDLAVDQGGLPAKRCRQDAESDLSTSDNPSTLDEPTTSSCFDPRRLSDSWGSSSHIALNPLESRESYSNRLDSSKPYDIGSIAEFARGLNREMFSVLNNVYKPPANYAFPQHTEGLGSHKRSFQQKWLKEHMWLTYSREKDGGYCVPCVFFCKNPEELGKLVNSPLSKWKDAVNTLRQHSKKSYHMHAVSDMLMFMQVMNNEQQPIDHQLLAALAQQVQTKRQILKSIIKTIIFCGKQNIALRGHRDDLQHLQQVGNHGNFHALVKF